MSQAGYGAWVFHKFSRHQEVQHEITRVEATKMAIILVNKNLAAAIISTKAAKARQARALAAEYTLPRIN